MKKVLLSVVAATTLATALPALAQPYGNAWGHPSNRGYDQGYGRWTPMEHRIRNLNERIERGIDRGLITRGEARRLRMELFSLVRLENRYRADGHLNGWERADLERRFDILRQRIRFERRDDDRRWDRDDDRRWDRDDDRRRDRDDDRRGRRGY